MADPVPQFPGVPDVINGNGAVAHVMRHVCDGVIGYPITPSTEISELFEAARADGQVNVWGRHPFFFEAEGEHSAQSGALGAALTGGHYISNASSSQGILYAMESHVVTAGKKIGGFVLQVAARVVSKHSLNVMAGHDDVYALLPSGYTILFGANPQEAADLAAIAYRTSALSLIPVANAMDGFATSHMISEVLLPEPELLHTYLGDPTSRIDCPTVAQDILFGARGRVFALSQYLQRHEGDLRLADHGALTEILAANPEGIEADVRGALLPQTLPLLPAELQASWCREWTNAPARGTRQLVPALVDVDNPGLTGPVQNQPDFQAGAADHRTHFAQAVPNLVRRAMDEYATLTGRVYNPVHTYGCQDADCIVVGMGSVTDDLRAVQPYLRDQGMKVGVVSVKLLHPFPEAELAAALAGATTVMVLERSDDTALTRLVTQALFKARANADGEQFPGITALNALPRLTTAIFGLGGHDLQPRHLIAACRRLADGTAGPLLYLGSQFFSETTSPESSEVQSRLREAYPETAMMTLDTEPNPVLLPPSAIRLRFHSVGGYGTVATGKLLTDILAGVLGMYSKSAPKYGSEKSGAATNYYITLSPEPVLITNAELEDVEVVISPDHQAFVHTNPLKGLVEGGTFIMQSAQEPVDVWRSLPAHARRTIRDRHLRFLTVDAFTVAEKHAPTADLQTRMMGIAFIGAVVGHVDRISGGAASDSIQAKVREQIAAKFGRKGEAVVEGNMAVIRDGITATRVVDYNAPALVAAEQQNPHRTPLPMALSAARCPAAAGARSSGLFDPGYYEELAARPFREGTIAEAPVLPGAGLFMPPGTGLLKNKGVFRREVPVFEPEGCTGCLECTLVCPDAAIPTVVHEIHELLLAGISQLNEEQVSGGQCDALRAVVHPLAEQVREAYRQDSSQRPFHQVVTEVMPTVLPGSGVWSATAEALVTQVSSYPVARTRPFFDAMEKAVPGTGGLLGVVVDPWKCTGCLQCVDVCGPGALTPTDQDDSLVDLLARRFETLTQLPDVPRRFVADALDSGGDTKRVLLDRETYYATTGGHGACRGCGEVTAIRLVTSLSHALGSQGRETRQRELAGLIAELRATAATISQDSTDSTERLARIERTMATLDAALYRVESGPTGNGPASTVISNSTGCSSVYSSTMPFTQYLDPWVNSLFQDAQPLAKGIFEGISAGLAQEVRAERTARLELANAYNPAVHDRELALLTWRDFTEQEMDSLPTVLTVGGDGASYDIGFGALSRVLTSATPITMLVLDTGAYSNTGGQASTASFVGQDCDLARVGGAHSGKTERRKELALLAAFHPDVFACSTSTALHGHFLATTLRLLAYRDGAAVMNVYAPCSTENGIAEDLSNARSRLAVETRMTPLFVHDPHRGTTLAERFSLEGNPEPNVTWATGTVEYTDDDGTAQLMSVPITPADFARGEGRFAKHFTRLAVEDEERALRIDEYVALPPTERDAAVPFLWATDDHRHLIRLTCSSAIVQLVEDRQQYWHTLQELAGQTITRLAAEHRAEVDELRQRYEQAAQARETSLDDIARAMSDLATSSAAPLSTGVLLGTSGATATPAGGPALAAESATGGDSRPQLPIYLDPDDLPQCNDCGTCYQDLPQFFEKATVLIDGESRTVGRMIPGSVDGVEVTEELQARITRVRDNCDAEIIR